MKTLILLVVLCCISIQAQQKICFVDRKINIDGQYNDWDRTNALKYTSNQIEKYRNYCEVNFNWDNENLYALFIIRDKYLIKNERGRDSKLYKNDAVFLYIDAFNDSKSFLNYNDYQFVVDVLGDEAVYKGDKFSYISFGNEMSEVNQSNILFNAVSNHKGTVNIQYDEDWGYVVELAIAWSAIGIKPHEDMDLKLTISVHDVDSRKEINKERNNNFKNSYISKKPDIPQFKIFKLAGKPGLFHIIKNNLTKEWIKFYFLTTFVVIFYIGVIYRKIQKNNGLKKQKSY